jgi:hypothetical protein
MIRRNLAADEQRAARLRSVVTDEPSDHDLREDLKALEAQIARQREMLAA